MRQTTSPAVVMFPGRNYPKDLQRLYNRLVAVDSMIEALEEYRRTQPKPVRSMGKRNSA